MKNRDLSYLKEYYSTYDEDARLVSKSGRIEFITTMKYIHDALKPGMRILEVGAGTGRYSLTLAHEGYQVDAVELIEHNLEKLLSQIKPSDAVTAVQGDALDLAMYNDSLFDLTLVLGPMYHLYNDENKLQCLKEALRVTKPNGKLMVAYCLNEATVLQYAFIKNKVKECLNENMLDETYKCISKEKDLFEMVRIEDIDALNKHFNVKRERLIAADGAAHYLKDTIDNMDDKTFEIYLDYHLKTCERADLIGAGNHVLDILIKGE